MATLPKEVQFSLDLVIPSELKPISFRWMLAENEIKPNDGRLASAVWLCVTYLFFVTKTENVLEANRTYVVGACGMSKHKSLVRMFRCGLLGPHSVYTEVGAPNR